MSATKVHHIESAFAPSCAASVRLSTTPHELFRGVPIATLTLYTGASSTQIYMTRAELADMILALQVARDELNEQMTPTQIVTDWAAA